MDSVILWGFSLHAWITIATVLTMFSVLLFTKLRADMVFLGAIALMISVSSSFATPIGSPTHMLVYAPGGYRFSDFIRIGLPMNFIILAANIFIVNVLYPLTPLNS